MIFRINDSPFAGQDGQVRHQPAAARPAGEGAAVATSPCASSPSEDARTSSTSPAAACCTWASCWRTCAARATSCRSASRKVIYRKDEDGKTLEPIEYLVVEVPAEHRSGR